MVRNGVWIIECKARAGGCPKYGPSLYINSMGLLAAPRSSLNYRSSLADLSIIDGTVSQVIAARTEVTVENGDVTAQMPF